MDRSSHCGCQLKPVTHVIFDCDGLILDTEAIHWNIIKSICKKYDRELSYKTKFKILGCQLQNTIKIVIEDYQLPITYEEFHRIWMDECEKLLPNCHLMLGVEKLITHFHKHKINQAVATSSSQTEFDLKTSKHRKLFNLFSHIVCGGSDPEVKNSKPAPDIYLICASRFIDKPKPDQCLVLEDAPNGVIGASAAGMQVVMVPDKKIDPELTKSATLVLQSLEYFQPKMFGLPEF